jgi:ribosomal protein S18 acetylase RimI-like enzyme
MGFTIMQAESKEDWDFFFDLSFRTLKILRKSFYDQLEKDNPEKSEEELLAANRKEMEDYADFQNPKTRVFIATNDDGYYCGYLWMGERNSEDTWDFQRPQWIYDIVVHPEFQGNGLGKMLMKKGEVFAKEMKRDIGLFVHEENKPAISLYKKMDYFVKCTPMSKNVSKNVSTLKIDDYSIRKFEDSDTSAVRMLGLASYREMVRISKDIPDAQIDTKYDEFSEKIRNSDKEHCVLVVETNDGKIVGFLVVSVSEFSSQVAIIYDSSFDAEHKERGIVEALITEAESWSSTNNLPTLYYLLNTNDVVSRENLQSLGFVISGYFMEKDLFRDVLT